MPLSGRVPAVSVHRGILCHLARDGAATSQPAQQPVGSKNGAQDQAIAPRQCRQGQQGAGPQQAAPGVGCDSAQRQRQKGGCLQPQAQPQERRGDEEEGGQGASPGVLSLTTQAEEKEGAGQQQGSSCHVR